MTDISESKTLPIT